MMWSDDRYDYFRTSDGYLYCVLRNLEREAGEVRFERAIRFMNWAFVCLVCAFVTADISILIVLLIGGSL